MKYDQVWDNQWEDAPTRACLACCDCGLVHDVEFRIKDGKFQWRFTRNNRATGQIRRYRKELKCLPKRT